MRSHRWLRRASVAGAYPFVWFVALGVAADRSDLAAGLVFTIGLAAPMFLWEWRLIARLNSRRPEHIAAALRRKGTVRLMLPRGTSAAWDPTRGLYGRVSGPGEVEYRLLDDASVSFTYRGRRGEHTATAPIPPVLVAGTPEANRLASVKHRLLGAALAFYGLLPASFVVGYFAFGGSRTTRATHGSIAVVTVLCAYVVATRILSYAIQARRRRASSSSGSAAQ